MNKITLEFEDKDLKEQFLVYWTESGEQQFIYCEGDMEYNPEDDTFEDNTKCFYTDSKIKGNTIKITRSDIEYET